MAYCIKCGKEIPNDTKSGLCIDCCKADLKEYFSKNPEVKQAFKESIEEMKKPENVKKMADDTVKFMQALQAIKQRNGG